MHRGRPSDRLGDESRGEADEYHGAHDPETEEKALLDIWIHELLPELPALLLPDPKIGQYWVTRGHAWTSRPPILRARWTTAGLAGVTVGTVAEYGASGCDDETAGIGI